MDHYKKALERIANPIKFLTEEAQANGDKVNGQMAFIMSKDPRFLQEIARKALEEPHSSPTATAEEKHFLLDKQIRYRYVDWEEGSFTPWYTCNQSDLKKILEDHSVEIVEFKP